ncbi:MAG TPA: HU family DNA-binding protein [Anaerolineales bacterium]|nr:HU family DNA-binding protein [Anaerolineales bacterium]
MKRKELIEELGARCGITASQSEVWLTALQRIIYDTLKGRGVVNWHGFGKFSVVNMKATTRRNPKGINIIKVPAHPRPKFVAGEQLKKSVL